MVISEALKYDWVCLFYMCPLGCVNRIFCKLTVGSLRQTFLREFSLLGSSLNFMSFVPVSRSHLAIIDTSWAALLCTHGLDLLLFLLARLCTRYVDGELAQSCRCALFVTFYRWETIILHGRDAAVWKYPLSRFRCHSVMSTLGLY